MKQEISTETAKETKEKNVSNPVRTLLTCFFILISFLLVWSMLFSYLIAPFFLLIMIILSLIYYRKDQWAYLIIMSVLIVGYFLIASISFPHCDSRSSATIIGYDYKVSCDCSGIKKKVDMAGYSSETQCIGIRKKCYKHPYDFLIAGRKRVEIPCDSIESAAREIETHEASGGVDRDAEKHYAEKEKFRPKLDYKRGTQEELEKYQASENFINIENIEDGISFFAVFKGRDCKNEKYSVDKYLTERTITVRGAGQNVCKKEVVNRVVKGTIVNLKPGKYKLKFDYNDPGPDTERGIWPKKPIIKTVLESEFEVE